MSLPSDALLLSCEHGGNRVPRKYCNLFHSTRAQAALASHRGLDLGALEVARFLARRFAVELHSIQTTRLLIDLNKSLVHRGLFSEFSAPLESADRQRLVADIYLPHRASIEAALVSRIARHGLARHIAVHSFTPVLNGIVRNAEIGLLYDPRRRREREFCARWKEALERADPRLRVRRNYPYLGRADGLTTALRARFAAHEYLGVELEINQSLLTGDAEDRAGVARTIAASLTEALAVR